MKTQLPPELVETLNIFFQATLLGTSHLTTQDYQNAEQLINKIDGK